MRKSSTLFALLLCSSVAFSQPEAIREKFQIEGLAYGSARPESPAPRQCPAPMNFGWWQGFANAWLYYTPNMGMVAVRPAIFAKWSSMNWEQGALGFPMGDEIRSVNTLSESIGTQYFQGGNIVHNYVTNITTATLSPTALAPGKYRLILTGFKVEQETQDDPLQRDGKGDEIFIRMDGFIRDDFGAVAPLPLRATKLMGDMKGFETSLRIKAGTRGDEGGLMTGNTVPLTQPWNYATLPGAPNATHMKLPIRVWEGDITNGNYLVFTPSVWEWDELRASWFENNWAALLSEQLTTPPVDYNKFRIGLRQQITPDKISGTTPVGLSNYWSNNKTTVVLQTPRFIATRQGVYFGPANYYHFAGANQNDNSHGPGVFEAVFQSTVAPYGSYRLYLKWERV